MSENSSNKNNNNLINNKDIQKICINSYNNTDKENINTSTNNVNFKSKKSKKSLKELNIELKYDNSENYIQKYISKKRKQFVSEEYKDINFKDQSCFRFILFPYSEPVINKNSNFEYDDIFLVKWFCDTNYSCPICLNNLTMSIITNCGHVYCFICIYTYQLYFDNNIKLSNNNVLNINKKNYPPCPLCKEKLIISNDIAFCELVYSNNYIPIEENNNLSKSKKLSHNSYSSYNSEKKNNKTLSYSTIVFNLVMRYSYVIYNLKEDPNLSLYSNYFKDCKILEYNKHQSKHSTIYYSTYTDIINKYSKYKENIENIIKYNLETNNLIKDDNNENKTIEAAINCINILSLKINKINSLLKKDKLYDMPIKDNKNMAEELTTNNYSLYENIKKFKFFYQENNGDIYYLHPINYNMLINEYSSLENLPTIITVNLNNII